MKKTFVLLVEDEYVQRKLITRWLELDCGLEVIAVADPIAAYEHIERSDVALLITDVLLSGGSGFDVLRMSKKAEPSRPVLLMSAHRNLNATLSKDAAAVVYKPEMHRGSFAERVRSLMSGGTPVDEGRLSAEYMAVTMPPPPGVLADAPQARRKG